MDMNIVALTYNNLALEYRTGDEIHLQGDEYRRKSKTLTELCQGFSKSIRVLELGCGTGRYFHAVRNAEVIVGVDGSEEMLKAARHPVRGEEIKTLVNLVQADFYRVKFNPREFHLVYLFGVFGNGCPITTTLLRNIRRWLQPGGAVYFDVTDFTSIPLSLAIRKRLKAEFYRLLPRSWQSAWDRRTGWPPFYLYSATELRAILLLAGFRKVFIQAHDSILPSGPGRKLEVIARA